MAIDIYSQLTSLTNLLSKNNTNTSSYDISKDMNIRVKRCFQGADGLHSQLPIQVDDYPVIFIELITQPEGLVQISNSPKRDVDIEFNIIPVTHYGASSQIVAPESVEAAHKELIILNRNIQNLLRNKITLSSTVNQSNIEGTAFGTSIREPQTYNVSSIIRLEAKKYST
jgi:hypothetical protein